VPLRATISATSAVMLRNSVRREVLTANLAARVADVDPADRTGALMLEVTSRR